MHVARIAFERRILFHWHRAWQRTRLPLFWKYSSPNHVSLKHSEDVPFVSVLSRVALLILKLLRPVQMINAGHMRRDFSVAADALTTFETSCIRLFIITYLSFCAPLLFFPFMTSVFIFAVHDVIRSTKSIPDLPNHRRSFCRSCRFCLSRNRGDGRCSRATWFCYIQMYSPDKEYSC